MTAPSPARRPDVDVEGATAPDPGPWRPVDTPVLSDDPVPQRVHRPVDLLRLVVAGAALAIVLVVAATAKATTAGVDQDVATAGRRVPGFVTGLLGSVTALALLVLPVALAVREVRRRRLRRLAEAFVTGGVGYGAASLGAWLVRLPGAHAVLDALTTRLAGGGATEPFDRYLVALVAYVTLLGLAGEVRWETAAWAAVALYGAADVALGYTTALSLLVTILLGQVVGLGARYLLGATSTRPPVAEVATALAGAGYRLAELRHSRAPVALARRYTGITLDGDALDVVVFDRDKQVAAVPYRIYRLVRLRVGVGRRPAVSLQRAVERRALLSYAVAAADVATPRLVVAAPVGPDAALLGYEPLGGRSLRDVGVAATDDQLQAVWRTVADLHHHRVTHRSLVASSIIVDLPGGAAGLRDAGDGDIAASDLQVRLDVAQLLTELACLVGPERAVASGLAVLGGPDLLAVVPLLQAVILQPSTRAAVKRQRGLLASVREAVLSAMPTSEVEPVRLERLRPRTVLSVVAGVAGAYVLLGQLAAVNLSEVVSGARWPWAVAALGFSALTYVSAAQALSGFVLERLHFVRTLLAQLAASFVTLISPAAVGGATLNVRYLQQSDVPLPAAVAGVGAWQVGGLAVNVTLITVGALLTGTSQTNSLRPPSWVFVGLVVVAVVGLIAVAVPPTRRLLRARLAPVFSEVIPRLLDIAQRPTKLLQGFGGALMLATAYIACLACAVHAFGGGVSLASIAVVYLAGSAVGSAAPTPGGLGAVEAALSAGLIAAGAERGAAISAVLLFRLVTFWLPVLPGWVAFTYLQRRNAI